MYICQFVFYGWVFIHTLILTDKNTYTFLSTDILHQQFHVNVLTIISADKFFIDGLKKLVTALTKN